MKTNEGLPETFAGTIWNHSLSIVVVQLIEQKPKAAIGHFCRHVVKTCQRMKAELRDGKRLISDDAFAMLDLAIPECILAFLAITSQYVPFFPPQVKSKLTFCRRNSPELSVCLPRTAILEQIGISKAIRIS